MKQAASGKEWDAEKREWILYYLHEEEKEVLTVSDEDFVADLKRKYGADYGKKSNPFKEAGQSMKK